MEKYVFGHPFCCDARGFGEQGRDDAEALCVQDGRILLERVLSWSVEGAPPLLRRSVDGEGGVGGARNEEE